MLCCSLVLCAGLYLQEWKFSRHTNRQVEIKILLILCCCFIVWSSIIILNLFSIIVTDDHQKTLDEYFTCEASGTLECEQRSTDGLEKVSRIVLYVLFSFYPAYFLIYLKKSLLTCQRCRLKFYPANENSSAV